MIHTDICDRIGIEYPIFQGGMAWVSEPQAGGGGVQCRRSGHHLGDERAGDYLRKEIRACRELTDKPFGVNVMLMSPFAAEVAKVILEEKVPSSPLARACPAFT